MRSLRKLPLLISSLTLAACSTSHEFRVAAVGDTEASEANGVISGPAFPGSPDILIPPGAPGAGNSAGTPPTAPPLIVASGNVLLGPAGQLATSGGPLNSAAGVVNGTVSAVLLTTTQTVVQLADGSSVLVNGVGAALGDAVSIDIAQGQMVGSAQSLVGSSVPGLSNTAGKTSGGISVAGSSGGSGRITAGGSSTLPTNAGKVLTPSVGVTTVIQPVTPPPPSLPVGF